MFKKVLEYTGEYRKTTYAAIVVLLVGIVMNVLPFCLCIRSSGRC